MIVITISCTTGDTLVSNVPSVSRYCRYRAADTSSRLPYVISSIPGPSSSGKTSNQSVHVWRSRLARTSSWKDVPIGFSADQAAPITLKKIGAW